MKTNSADDTQALKAILKQNIKHDSATTKTRMTALTDGKNCVFSQSKDIIKSSPHWLRSDCNKPDVTDFERFIAENANCLNDIDPERQCRVGDNGEVGECLICLDTQQPVGVIRRSIYRSFEAFHEHQSTGNELADGGQYSNGEYSVTSCNGRISFACDSKTPLERMTADHSAHIRNEFSPHFGTGHASEKIPSSSRRKRKLKDDSNEISNRGKLSKKDTTESKEKQCSPRLTRTVGVGEEREFKCDDSMFADAPFHDESLSEPRENGKVPMYQILPFSLCLPDSLYVALDCEMVGVGPNGRSSRLARCSIVDYSGYVLYDRFVRPKETITDYRTPWSGIRPFHMKSAIRMDLALKEIHAILDNKIIIGHSVYNDFQVLDMKPDFYKVRDTAQCKTLADMAGLQTRGNGLKKLAAALLDRTIQASSDGHCSVEDARAALDLFKLVRADWEPELYEKWARKNRDALEILANMEKHGENGHTLSGGEDFLEDKFWPSDVLC